MAKILRGYQQRLITGVYTKWQQGARVVGATLATGGGKTPIKARLAQELGGRGIIQAHRSELVGQISTALGAEGLRHNILASQKTIRAIVDTHLQELGHSMYDPRASWHVASTKTIIKNGIPDADKIGFHFIDEGHHVLRENEWGRAFAMTPNARGLLMTATSGRADGKGWGATSDGIVNALEEGPGAGELIRNGYLCSYEVAACRAADLDLSDVDVGNDGDHNKAQVQRAVKRSKKIIGDIVENYQRWALGKQAILFAVDIDHAGQIVSALQGAGIKAELVHGSTEEGLRRRIIKQFRERAVQVLVNVDLFGEGFDVPGVEVVIMARPTMSFPLFCQMIGRMLRLAITRLEMDMWETLSVADRLAIIARSPKPKALLIDHVGNVYQTWKIGQLTFGGPSAPVLPEGFTNWAAGMERRNKRASKVQDGIPVRSCETWYEPDRTEHKGCWNPFERTLDACPYCGNDIPPPTQRGTPQQVDGDIFLLDPDVLAKMRGEVARVDDRAYVPAGVDGVAARAITIRHHERQVAQHHLRNAIAVWAGRYPGKSEAYLHKLFWFTYGQTVISAASLGASDADALRRKLEVVT